MVLLEVAEIRTEPVSGAAVLLLREADGRRHLALWIADPEKTAIADAINETEPVRPLTHDLLARAIAVLCEEEPQCIITKVEDGIWFGELVLGDMRIGRSTLRSGGPCPTSSSTDLVHRGSHLHGRDSPRCWP